MKIGLFIPCFIDQFYPQVAIATLELLEKMDCDVSFPLDQTCCGQPMANSGCERDSLKAMRLFVKNFDSLDYIVTPSGSCALYVREHYGRIEQTQDVQHIRTNTFELCQFLTDILHVNELNASFPHKVGLHKSCHGHRGLRLGQASEINGPDYDKVRSLLELVRDIELIDLDRNDECCGFGGTFAVNEAAISVKMGQDRIRDHLLNGADVITGTDTSCLMHLEGIIRREAHPINVKHVAEILNGGGS